VERGLLPEDPGRYREPETGVKSQQDFEELQRSWIDGMFCRGLKGFVWSDPIPLIFEVK
jgi:hypothetical protein